MTYDNNEKESFHTDALLLVVVMVISVISPRQAKANPGWYNAIWLYRQAITINSSEVTNGSQQWSDGFATAMATTGVAPTPTPTLPPPVAVGGIIYPVDKARLLAPWLAFFTLSLATLGGFFVLKKLRV